MINKDNIKEAGFIIAEAMLPHIKEGTYPSVKKILQKGMEEYRLQLDKNAENAFCHCCIKYSKCNHTHQDCLIRFKSYLKGYLSR